MTLSEIPFPQWETIEPIKGDASSRRYFRVAKGDQTAIWMDCSAGQTRGHGLDDFVRIGHWLNDIGLNAPDIYELDEAGGHAIIEDFGDVTFSQALIDAVPVETLYGAGAEVLNVIADQKCPLELPQYYASHVHEGRRRVIDYFLPFMTGQKRDSDIVGAYFDVWDEIERGLPDCPQGFLHIDYHAQNLMWLPDREGLKSVGILDFQGAMIGPTPYDLANILEDPRQGVDEDFRAFILSHYSESYQTWFRVLATQFHCRVIGQFLKMALEGKSQYLTFVPQTHSYLRSALKHPVLRPLAMFFDDLELDFAQDLPKWDPETLKVLISEDVS